MRLHKAGCQDMGAEAPGDEDRVNDGPREDKARESDGSCVQDGGVSG